MPNLKFIMQNALSSDYRMLRGKTIECISLIGLAVGKEKVSLGVLSICQTGHFVLVHVRRQHSLAIRALDLKSGGSWFKPCPRPRL